MNTQIVTKLYPPRALLWEGPMPYQKASLPGAASTLSRDELRSIVSQMID